MEPLNNISCTAIETPFGLLFFSQDDSGRNLMQKYLQCLTDHYFDPDFDIAPVRILDLKDIPVPEACYLNPEPNALQNYLYLPNDRPAEESPQNIKRLFEHDMSPTSEAFSSFVEATKTNESHRNRNIRSMLASMESSERTVTDHALVPQTDEVLEQIHEAQQDYSDMERLLAKAYDIRGHRSLRLILENPDWNVRVDSVDLNIYHRAVLRDDHCVYLPEQKNQRPDHVYA